MDAILNLLESMAFFCFAAMSAFLAAGFFYCIFQISDSLERIANSLEQSAEEEDNEKT